MCDSLCATTDNFLHALSSNNNNFCMKWLYGCACVFVSLAFVGRWAKIERLSIFPSKILKIRNEQAEFCSHIGQKLPISLVSHKMVVLLSTANEQTTERANGSHAHTQYHKRNENRFDTILTSFGAVDKNHSGTKIRSIHDEGIKHSVNRKGADGTNA